MAMQLMPTSDSEHTDQVHFIETRLDQLSAERFNLLRQLNNFRARTHVFPPEVLSQIFVMTGTPLRLGAVCSSWRGVVWETPELWTTIKCDPAKDPQKNLMDDSLYLLRLFFKNSQQLKVTVELIDIDRWHVSAERPETIHEILEVVTMQHGNRIKELMLKSSDSWDARMWKVVHPYFQTRCFPNLEFLHLTGCTVTPIDLQNAPRLHQFSASNVQEAVLHRNQFYWNQLTVIRLKATPLLYCFQALRFHPPHLETFECVDPITNRAFIAPTSTDIITLDCLTSFEWTGKLGALQRHLWNTIDLPNIRQLTWNYPCSLTENWTDIRQNFFRRFSKLEVLKIHTYDSIRELRDLWQCLDSLIELDLDACKLDEDGINVMHVLTLLDDPNHQNLLPNLKILRINALIGLGISQMLRSRRDGPLSMDGTEAMDVPHWKTRSRLEEAVIRIDLGYDPDEWEALKELVNGGLRLDMIVGDEIITWI